MISDRDVEVLTQPERWRRWSVEQKLAIVAQMMQPGTSATRVARRYAISTGLLYTWRRLTATGELSLPAPAVTPPAFMPIRVAPDADDTAAQFDHQRLCDRYPAHGRQGDRQQPFRQLPMIRLAEAAEPEDGAQDLKVVVAGRGTGRVCG